MILGGKTKGTLSQHFSKLLTSVPSDFSLELVWPRNRVFVKFSPEKRFEYLSSLGNGTFSLGRRFFPDLWFGVLRSLFRGLKRDALGFFVAFFNTQKLAY